MFAPCDSNRHKESTGHVLAKNFEQHHFILDRVHDGEVHDYFFVAGLDVVQVVLSQVSTPQQCFVRDLLHCGFDDDLLDSLTQHVNLQLRGNAHPLNFHLNSVVAHSAKSDKINFLLVLNDVPVWPVFDDGVRQLEGFLNRKQGLISIE